MRVAVEGCAHGELEIIYAVLKELEAHDGNKIDLLICCGDFQSTRNLTDLSCMAVPDKYKDMCTFYKYYSGEKVAPVLTIFIGGNHEASNYLQELSYGGWVAPNIYYLGYAGVVTVAGIRIAGISGIYKSHDFWQGHWEKPPYNYSSIRSVYHIRNLEVFRLKQLSGKIDMFLSHDWPRGITEYGDEQGLLKIKPYFRNDIASSSLGSPPCMELLTHHYPSFWFSAHLHCKFAAIVNDENDASKLTKFLALDKCLPRRKFLQVVDVPHDENKTMKISYDLEWLTILYLTNHLLSVKSGTHHMPGQGGNSRWMYTPTESEKEMVLKKFENRLEIPENFTKTAPAYNPEAPQSYHEPARLSLNPQTTYFTDKLGIDDPSALLQIITNTKDYSFNTSATEKASDSRNTSSTFDDDNQMSTAYDSFGDFSNTCSLRDSSVPLSPEKTVEHFSSDEKVEQFKPEDEVVEDKLVEDKMVEDKMVEDKMVEDKMVEDKIVEDKMVEDKMVEDKIVELIDAEVESNRDETVSGEPNCKKFKRRNHSLYSETTGE